MSVKRISIGSGTTVCYADDGQAVAYEDYAAVEKLCRQQHEALENCDTDCNARQMPHRRLACETRREERQSPSQREVRRLAGAVPSAELPQKGWH